MNQKLPPKKSNVNKRKMQLPKNPLILVDTIADKSILRYVTKTFQAYQINPL